MHWGCSENQAEQPDVVAAFDPSASPFVFDLMPSESSPSHGQNPR